MAKATTPMEAAEKWARSLLAAKEDIKAGINAVTVAPGEKAAKAVDRYRSGCEEAASSGRFEKACRRVTLNDWKTAAVEKLKNLDTGVRLAQPKVVAFQESFLPYIREASKRIEGMAKGGRAESMARIEANLDALEQYRKSKGRG